MIPSTLSVTPYVNAQVLKYARQSCIEPSVLWDVANQIFSRSVANVSELKLDEIVCRSNETLRKARIGLGLSSVLILLSIAFGVSQASRIGAFFRNAPLDLLCILLVSASAFLCVGVPYLSRLDVYLKQLKELSIESKVYEVFNKYRSEIAIASSLQYLSDVKGYQFQSLFCDIVNGSAAKEILCEARMKFLDSIDWRFPMSLTHPESNK